MVTKICQTCGKEYQIKPSKENTSKYCSKNCHIEAQKGICPPHTPPHKTTKVTCAYCGKEFYVSPSKAKLNKKFFCNNDCKAKYNKSIQERNNCICENCGETIYKKSYDIKRYKHHFCSSECAKEYRKKRVIVQCEFCGKDIEKHICHVKRLRHNFCSRECQGNWMRANVIGKSHPLHNQVEATCEQCGRVFERKPSQVEKYNQSFCCKECHFEYQRTHPISEEQRAKHRKTALKTLATYPRETSIEKAIREWLELHKIKHYPQYIINDKFCVDFYLPEHNTIIEALGDYYHANPLVYGEGLTPLNDIQIKNNKMDKARFAYLRKCGYMVYGFWECDIRKDVDGLMRQVV